ncbi:MAG: TonB-dependent receptor plug domain-containing protein, partial [Bacteroidota bacterium]|nr:TonB-dependent receptor plug domain-containing protein [Bacteroidota bacterium]
MNFKQMTFVCMGLLCTLGAAADMLDSTKVYPIQEVTVHASRMERKLKDLPQKVEIITSEVIQSLPSENLAEVLKRTTNLDIIQYPGLSATIGMRGFSPSAHARSYTLLLIDGKPSGTTN